MQQPFPLLSSDILSWYRGAPLPQDIKDYLDNLFPHNSLKDALDLIYKEAYNAGREEGILEQQEVDQDRSF